MLATTGMHPMPRRSRKQRRIGAVRLANKAKVHQLARHRAQRRRPAREADPAVGAGQSDRSPAGRTDGGNQRRVRAASEHRDDRVECGRVGDPQPVDKPRRLAARAQFGVDGPAAAVDDHERPEAARRTMASAAERTAAASSSSSPPSLRTVVAQFSPIVSSKPNATLKF